MKKIHLAYEKERSQSITQTKISAVCCSFIIFIAGLLYQPLAFAQLQQLTVIVDMTTPFSPEGVLSAQGLIDQRAAIIADRNAVLGSLPSGFTLKNAYLTIPSFTVTISPVSLPLLQINSLVKGVTVDSLAQLQLSQSRVVVGTPEAENLGYNGSGTTVAVLDTGVEKTNPSLSGKVISEACYSTTSSDGTSTSVCPGGQNSTSPGSAAPCSILECDHGTHVAGIVAAAGSVKGVAPGATIIAIQIFSRISDTAKCSAADRSAPCLLTFESDQIAGLDRVNILSSQGANIASVNMSYGGQIFSSACDSSASGGYTNALNNLRSRNIAPVAAAGNNDSSTGVSLPACISTVIAVGNTTKSDIVYHGSGGTNSSSLLKFWAPGQSIASTCGTGTCVKSGTSMASPHIAGSFAVLRHFLGSRPVDEVQNRLVTTGQVIVDASNSVSRPRPNIGKSLGLPGTPKNVMLRSGYCKGDNDLYWGAADGIISHYELWRSGTATSVKSFFASTGGLEYNFEIAGGKYIHLRACNGSAYSSFVTKGPTKYYEICQ